MPKVHPKTQRKTWATQAQRIRAHTTTVVTSTPEDHFWGQVVLLDSALNVDDDHRFGTQIKKNTKIRVVQIDL